MNEDFAEKVVKKQLAKLYKSVAVVKAGAHGKAIHAMRVSYKKLRAVLRMCGSDTDMPAELKKLYHAAGAVRDKELFLHTIAAYCTQSGCSMPVYLSIISVETGNAAKELDAVINATNWAKVHKAQLENISCPISAKDISGFIERQREKAGKLLHNRHSDEALHGCRKHLKDALYCLKAVKQEEIYTPHAYKKLEKLLDAATKILGKHQDLSTQIQIATAALAGLPGDEAKILETAIRQWIDRKAILKHKAGDITVNN